MSTKLAEICPGCGSRFQSQEPGEPGYLPPGVREARSGETLICRSCFRLANYGEFLPRNNWSDEDYRRVFREAIASADLALIIVDLLDFEGSWWPAVWSEIPLELPVYIVANKMDLLPDKAVYSEVAAWVRTQVSQKGRRPAEVFLVSAQKGSGLAELESAIKRQAKSVAVIGATNTGKSSLIKSLVQPGEGAKTPVISAFPGTTLGVIPVDVPGAKYTLLDTPGLIPPGRLSDYYCTKCSSNFIPNRRFTSKLYELTPGQSLLFGGVAALTALQTDELAAVTLVYVPDGVVLHRTRAERIPEVMGHAGDWLVPPCASCQVPALADWDQYEIPVGRNEDLAIAGLGWVSLRRGGALIKVQTLPGVRLRTRPALVGPRR